MDHFVQAWGIVDAHTAACIDRSRPSNRLNVLPQSGWGNLRVQQGFCQTASMGQHREEGPQEIIANHPAARLRAEWNIR